MIKTEPLSEDVNVTVIDDEQDARSATAGITSKAGVTRQQQVKQARKRVQNQLQQQQTTATAAATSQASSKVQFKSLKLLAASFFVSSEAVVSSSVSLSELQKSFV